MLSGFLYAAISISANHRFRRFSSGESPPVAIHHRVTFSGECWFSLCLAYFLASYRRSSTIKLVGFTKLVECTKIHFGMANDSSRNITGIWSAIQ